MNSDLYARRFMGSMKCPVIYSSPIGVVWCGVLSFVCLPGFSTKSRCLFLMLLERGEECVCVTIDE